MLSVTVPSAYGQNYVSKVRCRTLRTWLRRRGLRALSMRPQRPRTTVTDPAAVVAENLLFGQSAPTALN